MRLLTAANIPAGYRKMIRVQLMGDLDLYLTLFTPNSAGEALLLADAVVGGHCTTMVATNKGAGGSLPQGWDHAGDCHSYRRGGYPELPK